MNIFSYLVVLLFSILGLLNVLWVHPVPGLAYFIFAIAYLPWTTNLVKQKFGIAIPLAIKIIFVLVLLWGTLAITDLAEILGF
jgi:hypothetical protein